MDHDRQCQLDQAIKCAQSHVQPYGSMLCSWVLDSHRWMCLVASDSLGACADAMFVGLAAQVGSAGVMLRDSTAAFTRSAFANITGPMPCAVVHVAGGELMLQQTSMRRDIRPVGSAPVCVATAASLVFSDRGVAVHNEEEATLVVPQTADSAAGLGVSFLSPQSPDFILLTQVWYRHCWLHASLPCGFVQQCAVNRLMCR